MAINVNTVYQTVLLILNKEQRGYMTPVEFNKTGTQSQLEIFETYFDSLNQQIRIPQTNEDYADRVVNLDEKISIFKTSGNASYQNSLFNIPSQFSGSGKQQTTTTPANTTAATLSYTINGITAAQIADGVTNVYVNEVLLSEFEYSISGTVLTFASQPIAGNPILLDVYPKEFYRLGSVIYTAGLKQQELERVSRSELYHLNASNLTKPSTTYPIYLYENNKLNVFPTSIVSGISVNYIRKPLNPVWSFTAGTGAYVYNNLASTDFELHPAEQTELITRILLYAGVVIQSPEIIQVAAAQIQQEEMNQKS